ncbi:MAG: adenine deaminase [Saprospiraceae bacterium]|nr:adenine deaminase [Saprospiraceae bacterium]
MKIRGNLVDIPNRKIRHVQLEIQNGKIKYILALPGQGEHFILPGFVDAHVHIESSMLVPSEFAKLAVVHGTVGTVSDPHEIANVNGLEGVKYMIENGKTVPFKFSFGAPSCVPATNFESAGNTVGVKDIAELLAMPDIRYLAEMMNYPGVLHADKEVMHKIGLARLKGKPIDGHAPGLRGADLDTYIAAGISTDHECFTYEEGLEKLQKGMKVLIREGSAAKNFEALIPLMSSFAGNLMFCSDDKHPDDLLEGHINQLVVRAIEKGHDLFDVLQAACINPVKHYSLPIGLLKEGDPADFIVVENLERFPILATYIDGQLVAENGTSFIKTEPAPIINHFNAAPKSVAEFAVKAAGQRIQVIRALDGELITQKEEVAAKIVNNKAEADTERDILKLVVVNRYENQPPAIAFISGFGLQRGALASCVAHDSHNIVAVGTNDEDICKAVNLVVAAKGGISIANSREEKVLALPVAGIMTNQSGVEVGKAYAGLDRYAKEELGSTLRAPFMTLSFMALLVIPSLKLSDKGLFDGKNFTFTSLFLE